MCRTQLDAILTSEKDIIEIIFFRKNSVKILLIFTWWHFKFLSATIVRKTCKVLNLIIKIKMFL